MVNLLVYIRDNKTLILKYYADIKDAPIYNMLIQAGINNDNQLMDFSDSICQYFLDTGRSTGAYIMFY